MLTEEEVLDRTKRTVTCLDLAGHTKYLKTTMSGMLGRTPDYVCIHISVIQGMVEMTLEHIALALYIGVPIMIVLTKIDLLPSLVSNTTSIATHASIVDIVQQIQSLIHPRKCRIIEDMKALDDYFHMSTEDISALVPIFFLSNVTGQGVDVIKSYFFKIPVHPQTATAATSYTSSSNEVVVRILGVIGRSDAMDSTSDEDNDELEQDQAALVGSDDTIKPLQDLINYTFGTAATSANLAGYDGEVEEEEYPVILIGKVHCGVLRVGDEMFLGPSSSGQFIPFHVSTIQRNKVAIKSATKGQTVTFCLTPTTQVTPTVVSGFGTEADSICQVPVSTRKYRQGTKKRHLRGLVLLDMQIAPKAYFEFEAKMVMVMQPQIKLRSNHQPVVHIGHIRQSVKVISMQLLSSVDNSTDEDGKEHATESIMVDEVTQGQHVLIRLRFAYNPEYIQIGETLIIREDRTRAVGRIVQVYS